jgi:hypothetical protein
VPVPCISKALKAASDKAAPSALAAVEWASLITACCEGPLGAVSELERPSWFECELTTRSEDGDALELQIETKHTASDRA